MWQASLQAVMWHKRGRQWDESSSVTSLKICHVLSHTWHILYIRFVVCVSCVTTNECASKKWWRPPPLAGCPADVSVLFPWWMILLRKPMYVKTAEFKHARFSLSCCFLTSWCADGFSRSLAFFFGDSVLLSFLPFSDFFYTDLLVSVSCVLSTRLLVPVLCSQACSASSFFAGLLP